MNKGDRVKIIGFTAPPDKKGQIGIVQCLASNGAFVKLEDGRFTPVKFENLEVVENSHREYIIP